MSFEFKIKHYVPLRGGKSCNINKCNWTKASSEDIDNYRHISEHKLADIVVPKSVNCTNCHCSLDNHKDEINLLCNTIIDSCVSAGKNCIPLTKHHLKKKSVPGWVEQVAPQRERSLLWHWIWQEAGKPNNGHIYHIMKRTRHQYHYSIRLCKKSKQMIQKQKLAENISHHVDFWKELKKINPITKCTTEVMDQVNGNANITELLVKKYKTLYNSVKTSEKEYCELNTAIANGVTSWEVSDYQVKPYIIEHCIKRLKRNKDDGSIGFNSNHLLYGGKRLHVLLSLLFNLMLMHGYTPVDLLQSSIISIPKDLKASLCNSNNYRGISLFNAICKVFDYVIIYLCSDFLNTSDMQFGFKPKHSTVLCSVIYKELIDNYNRNGSNVYSCLLDASKAFDKIHYGKLFNVLLRKDVPFCIIRILLDAYTRQQARVLWNTCTSDYFTISNGVKQGGVLSPILFSMYIDRLLILLKESGIGCHLNGTYCGALAYADDITISCPSRRGLNRLLYICHTFALSNDITFNTKKTMCIKYGEPVKDSEKIILDRVQLKYYETVRHLGNFFNNDNTGTSDINYKCSSFIGYFNKMMSHYSHLQPDVLCRLFKSYCCSFYGSFLWQYNSKGFEKICITWNKAVRKMYSLPYDTHRWILGPLTNQRNIRYQLFARDIKLLHSIKYEISNSIVSEYLSCALSDSNTVIGYKLAFYRENFNISILEHDLKYCLEHVKPEALSIERQSLITCLQELSLAKCRQLIVNGFNNRDLDDMINFVCSK